MTIKISVIVPICITNEKDCERDIGRLSFCTLFGKERPSFVEIIVVDSSFHDDIKNEIKSFCKQNKYIYVNDEQRITKIKDYKLSHARNYAARMANGEYLLFMDVDLLVYLGFYNDLYNFIEHYCKHYDMFWFIPVIYLNEENSKFMLEKQNITKYDYMEALLKNKVDYYSFGTSVLLISKLMFSIIGGYNENFKGWGFEDYEFQLRCIKFNPIFPFPKNWSSMKGNFMSICEYSGWKSMYKLYGEIPFYHSIVLAHIYHGICKSYKNSKTLNKNNELLKEQLKYQSKNIFVNCPIPMKDENVLIMKKTPFSSPREVLPLYGNIKYFSELKMNISEINFRDFMKIIEKYNINKVVFHNPYATEHMLKIYNGLRSEKFPIIVCERGALPNSSFFDEGGFLTDSNRYDATYWDRPLTNEEILELNEYVNTLKESRLTLEKQYSNNIYKYIEKLSILDKKILFVPFQLKCDTTVMYFYNKKYDTFIKRVEHLSRIAEKYGYVLLYKNHPLSVNKIYIKNAINVDKFHINDILSISDKIYLINSGVGLLGMLYNKKVYIDGKAFYNIKGINKFVGSLNEAELGHEIFSEDYVLDIEKINRFLYYLIFKFYSFGKHYSKTVDYNGEKMTATYHIDYYRIALNNKIYTFNRGYEKFDIGFFYRCSNNKELNNNILIRKLKKLYNHPLLFFKDAIKNRF